MTKCKWNFKKNWWFVNAAICVPFNVSDNIGIGLKFFWGEIRTWRITAIMWYISTINNEKVAWCTRTAIVSNGNVFYENLYLKRGESLLLVFLKDFEIYRDNVIHLHLGIMGIGQGLHVFISIFWGIDIWAQKGS